MAISDWRLSYEISPIVLVNGIATGVTGQLLPVISLIQAQNFTGGILQTSSPLGFNDFVGHFEPLPGATLIDNQIGEYPFANQQIAANAIIAMPLKLSMLMIAPAPSNGGYNQKIAAFTSLQQSLYQHTLLGGTYIVATPSYIYDGMLLTGLRDVSSNDTVQPQTRWQWDFVQPLLTQAQATAAQNSLLARSTAGLQTFGDPPSTSGAQNANASSGASQGVIPAGVSTNSVFTGVSTQGGANPSPSTAAGGPGGFVPGTNSGATP